MEEKKRVIKIPVSGSLGLLALGHKGLIAWRKVRDAAKEERNIETEGND